MKLGRPYYRGRRGYQHGSPRRVGVLLANLGTPARPDASALRPYLRQFLSDPRVIEFPRWLWWCILNGAILPFRAPRSAAAYREVWTEEGSPLLVNSQRQLAALRAAFDDEQLVFELGMSYGEPSIASALRRLHDANCSRLLVLPLYPQYAASTVGSVFDAVAKELSSWRLVPHLRMIAGYGERPAYIETLAASIRAHREEHGKPQLTLFSFHGTQLAALQAGDPYHCQCHRCARETAAALGLDKKEWLVVFQSRFGRDPWLQPYAIEMMEQLPQQGVTDIQIVSPAFSSDCLETLEEIAGEFKEEFAKHGGEKFSYIPALNDAPAHIDFLAGVIRSEINDWLQPVAADNQEEQRKQRQDRYAAVEPLTTGKRRWQPPEPDGD